MRKAFLVLMLFLFIIPSLIGCAPPDPLTDTVIKADLIVLGTITEKRYDVVTIVSENSTGKLAYTFFTLSVEKVIKGDPDTKEVLIKVEGGPIGEVYQAPTGGYFLISDHVLLSLIREDADVYTLFAAPRRGREIPIHGGGGVLWIQGETISSIPLEEIMGRICKILRVNRIPISLNEPCPEPAYEPASPPKQ
jgi:hypothetical protein